MLTRPSPRQSDLLGNKSRLWSLIAVLSLICVACVYMLTNTNTPRTINTVTNNEATKAEVINTSEQLGSQPVFGAGAWVDLQQPLSKITLGRAGWAYIHQTAAMYPVTPTERQRTAMRNFIESITVLYPCKMCRDNFDKWYSEHSTSTMYDSRDNIQQWLCEAHNDVNKRTDKPQISCDINTLEQLWPSKLKPSCDCQIEIIGEKTENADAKTAEGPLKGKDGKQH